MFYFAFYNVVDAGDAEGLTVEELEVGTAQIYLTADGIDRPFFAGTAVDVLAYFKKLVVVRRFLQKILGFYLVAENRKKRGCVMLQKLLLVIAEIVVFV